MRRGFNKKEIEQIERKIADIHNSFDALTGMLRDKMSEGEVWVEERSDKWHEGEQAELFSDWISELDAKADEIECIRDEVAIDVLEEIL